MVIFSLSGFIFKNFLYKRGPEARLDEIMRLDKFRQLKRERGTQFSRERRDNKVREEIKFGRNSYFAMIYFLIFIICICYSLLSMRK
jgi:hypothetical protein